MTETHDAFATAFNTLTNAETQLKFIQQCFKDYQHGIISHGQLMSLMLTSIGALQANVILAVQYLPRIEHEIDFSGDLTTHDIGEKHFSRSVFDDVLGNEPFLAPETDIFNSDDREDLMDSFQDALASNIKAAEDFQQAIAGQQSCDEGPFNPLNIWYYPELLSQYYPGLSAHRIEDVNFHGFVVKVPKNTVALACDESGTFCAFFDAIPQIIGDEFLGNEKAHVQLGECEYEGDWRKSLVIVSK